MRGRAAELMRERGYRSAVAAPIVAGGRTWGLLLVASAGSLGADAEHRLAGFAELVALALESAEARAELNASRVRILEAGVTERRRLERNLHDGAQQRLVALAVQLRVLEKRLGEPETHAAARGLGRARRTRWPSCASSPAACIPRCSPTAASLPRWRRSPRARRCRCRSRACRSSGSRSRSRPRCTSSSPRASPTRSSTPTRASCRCACRPPTASCSVEIADDGRGGADPRKGDGTGLRGLADRVEALGGRLALESPPGAGTVVRAVLPILRRRATDRALTHSVA